MKLFKLLIVLCTVLLGLYCPVAFADTRPIITLSVGSPFLTSEQRMNPKQGVSTGDGVYNIKIFANGRVEYNGLYSMQVLGQREYQIDKATLKKLLNDIKKESALSGANLKLSYVRDDVGDFDYHGLIHHPLGIRFRSGQKDITVIGSTAYPFYRKIIDAIKSEQLGNLHIVIRFRPPK